LISYGTPKAKANGWGVPDSEARKRGEQKGLDTLVVHAVNDVHLLFRVSTLEVAELTR
jgi:hypothetical protein